MRGIHRGPCIALLAALIAVAASKATADDILPCRRFTAENLPQPYPRGDRRGIERLKQINQTMKDNPHSVLFFGRFID